MLVLCVARHPFIAEHLARVLHGAGAEVRAAVGIDGAVTAAAECRPDVIAAEYELLASASIAPWESEAALRATPVMAFSLTRGVGEADPLDTSGIGGFFNLPRIGGDGALQVLRSAARGGAHVPVVPPLPWPPAPRVVTR